MRVFPKVLCAIACLSSLLVGGCTAAEHGGAATAPAVPLVSSVPDPQIDRLIEKYAAFYGVPADLVRRVVARESRFDPGKHHRGNWGLMQIKAATARTMGYRGPARGLLDAETNLKYGVKYLRGAYLVARGDAGRAAAYYRSGYYYRARRMGMLRETGLR